MRAALSDESHPLRLLAAAVVGRPVSITYLVRSSLHSYSDGERICLAAELETDERRRVVLVQGALIVADSLNAKPMRALLGRAELTQRYLLLEVERAAQLLAARLPASFLAQLALHRSGTQSTSALDSLRIARSRRSLPTPPAWYGALQPLRILRRALRAQETPLTEQKLVQLEAQLKQISEDSPEEDEALTKTSFWQWLSSPLASDSMMSRFLREILDMRSSPGRESAEAGSAAAELIAGRASKRVRDIGGAIRSTLELSLPSSFAHSESGAHSYPEWDCETRRYRPHWVNVEEAPPHAAEPQFAAGSLTGSNLPYQRALSGLCLGHQRHRGQAQGDELVLDRVIRLAVDLRSGHNADTRVYAANLRTRRDLGVLILLDASSSTFERSADGARVFDLQAQLAWQLCRAFATLGDRVALYGFNSWGRTLVRFQTVKGFDEPAGAALETRLRHLAVAGYTRCGAALRHATALVEAHAGTPHKLLILLSDGYPYDDQYENQYAFEDTRKAIDEARARGVGVVCLSVGSDADRARLESVYGASHYLAIDRTEQMAPRLRRLVESAVAASFKKAA